MHVAELDINGPVGTQMHRLLRGRIVRGELMPGTIISETEIAMEYTVSRQPVREAFIKLAEENLVEVRPQRGTFIRRIPVSSVVSAQFVRESVEADIVRMVAGNPSKAILEELDRLSRELIAAADDPEAAHFVALDEAFHSALIEEAGQTAVAEILQGLKTQMNRVRHLTLREFSRAKVVKQHGEIPGAIRARNPEAACDAMRLHLREILNDLPAIVKALPDCFDREDGKIRNKW